MTANVIEFEVVEPGTGPGRFIEPVTTDEDEWDDEGDGLPGGRELLIAIDGRLELARWGGMGVEANSLLNPEMPLLTPEGEPVDAVVQRCSCGETGCGSLKVKITREGGVVRWTNFRDGGRPVDLGPFEFDADDYDAAVRRAHEDRPWESRSERIARLLADRLHGERAARPLAFTWASAATESAVFVSYVEVRPNPEAGRAIPVSGPSGAPGWSVVAPHEWVNQYIGRFGFNPSERDDEILDVLLQRLRATHPHDWPPSGLEEDDDST